MSPNPHDVRRQVRESLGLPLQPDVAPTLPVEGHVCEFPLWAYSKKRDLILDARRIRYEDGSYVNILAFGGFPSMSAPGYLDVLLFYGDKGLFRSVVEMSVYSILKHLGKDPEHGGNYRDFMRDMRRYFRLEVETDRFIDPVTRQRSHRTMFRVLDGMQIAKDRKAVSRFYFNEFYLQSLRSGYMTWLDVDFCLHLDRNVKPLARFLYGYLVKRLGKKPLYSRSVPGFLTDVGLGQVAEFPAKELNRTLKRTVYPALDLIKGEGIGHYEPDGRGNLLFFPKP